MNDRLEKLNELLKSPEGKVSMKNYFDKLADKEALDKKRFKRFEKWLETNDFNVLMERLISEHDDNYIDKCYHNGYMPYPNRKLCL